MFKPRLKWILGPLVILFIIWHVVLPSRTRIRLQQVVFATQAPLWNVVPNVEKIREFGVAESKRKTWWIHKVKELMRENVHLKLQLANAEQRCETAKQILGINGLPIGESFKCVTAHVIYRMQDTWSQFIVINRGAKDGIAIGQGVLCTEGIVGCITNVSQKTAMVMLVTHPDFRLLVRCNVQKELYVLCGLMNKKGWNSTWYAQLKNGIHYYLQQSEVKTVSVGNIFPDNIHVGTCVRVKEEHGQLVGTVQIGEYLKWLDEVGVLIPVDSL
ncbi:MAG TPA: hypothetical protein DEW74_00235 [Opitutae bacterium]|nr:hypothetical protein [Opitutae bacterium]